MQPVLAARFVTVLEKLSASSESYVADLVRLILAEARQARASDVHLVPTENVLLMQWRIDGVLHEIAAFDRELATRVVARLKVMCGLLTYRTDVPQEGRVSREYSSSEVRVTTFPSLYGEKTAIRLFAEKDQLLFPDQLGLPPEILMRLHSHLQSTAGVVLLTGPSGSGKTTTAYACLREIARSSQGTRCLMTLEDPVEVAVEGATQSQVRPSAGFSLSTGIRSLMRQDPDVILVGEIRDPETAEAAFQAALTGHLVLTTFHAGSAVEAIARLLDMQIEPYLIRSGLREVLCQRLLRRACPSCGPSRRLRETSENLTSASKQTDESASVGTHYACSTCGSTGYFGRLILAESLDPELPDVARAILQKLDARQLAAMAEHSGMTTLRQAAVSAVSDGLTTQSEVLRVLGGRCFV